MHKPLSKTTIKKLNKKLTAKVSTDCEVVFLLQDVTDPINVGSFFRIADGLGINKIYMTGNTPTPPDGGISLTSRGMERRIEFELHENTEDLIKELKKEKFEIIAVELTEDSKIYNEYEYNDKVCLVMGNEASGVYKSTLKLCDAAVAIPMLGKGPSLNVNVAGAIVASHIIYRSN